MSAKFDLAVVMTAHNETIVSAPTIEAADLAVECAVAAGYSVQRLIVLDNATESTTEYFMQDCFNHWEKWVETKGDLGLVRNAVIDQLDCENVAFLDADDLFSENWLKNGLDELAKAKLRNEKAILHPELNWFFDGGKSAFTKINQDSILFDPYHFVFANYYDSLCMSPLAAHKECRYVSREVKKGLAFQDWQYGVETMDQGWKHIHAPDTIIFKRKRDNSLVSDARAHRSILRMIEPLAIDNVDKLGAT